MSRMLSLPIYAFAATALLTSSNANAWGPIDSEEDGLNFDPMDAGQVSYVSSTGSLESHPALAFDVDERVTKMDKFAAHSFWGDSIDFRGREIRNAALMDPSIEGLRHLTVDSISLRSSATGKNGLGVAMIDGSGMVSTASNHMRWDDKAKELKVPSLSAFSKAGLEIRSAVDFTSHELKNAKLAANTTLEKLVFLDGYIQNTVLHNVTATHLGLGDVKMDSLSISEFDYAHAVGSFLTVGPENGVIEFSSDLKKDNEGRLLVGREVVFSRPIDFNGQDVINANIKSGRIDGPVDLVVDVVNAESISLRGVRDDKTVVNDGLALIGLDGKLKMSPISIDSNGVLGDFKVHGTIDFAGHHIDGGKKLSSTGKITGAHISGGKIDALEKLGVKGEAEIGSGLQVNGDTYLDGDLSVSGSVLGSGPYVDVSDRRLKKNVESIDSRDALLKLTQLQGVSYELHLPSHHRLGKINHSEHQRGVQRRQFGLLAQDVEEIFPELVDTDEQAFKGLQYSRFVPILIEGMKELFDMNSKLLHEVEDLRHLVLHR